MVPAFVVTRLDPSEILPVGVGYVRDDVIIRGYMSLSNALNQGRRHRWAVTGMRLWGQNYVFSPTENQQALNEEYLFTQEQNIKLAGR